ncbi:hypothetical protein NPE20_18515 [Mucilaginibacter sp. JC4]|uniref:Uncharacterized protein n=1 Tax=Mucilaginibacter aquariorum TaxID=2967225 RepID=A0ABT1T5V9_9SPHI|nr:hypothetical protein [Mucilaginibacter aquariorum]
MKHLFAAIQFAMQSSLTDPSLSLRMTGLFGVFAAAGLAQHISWYILA